VLGLAAGTGLYYLVAAAGFGAVLGPTMGAIPAVASSAWYAPDLAGLLGRIDRWDTLAAIVAAGFSLALVASLDTLLSTKTVEAVTGERRRGNAELLRLGVANIASAAAGGIGGSINLTATFAAHRAGARTAATLLVNAACVLLAILVLAPAVAYLPRVVIAGLLLVVAVQLVDPWTLQAARRIRGRELADRRRMALDLGVTVLVAALAVLVDLVVAVGAGVAVAVLFFLSKMSKTVVRREYRGDAVHSRKTRPPRLMDVLQAQGGRILVLELEGPIFFGTAEGLARRIEAARDDVAYVVLDLKRVNEIDTTGARVLLQLHRRLQDAGTELLLSHVGESGPVVSVLADMGIARTLGSERLFGDTDQALEWAEEHLIARTLGAEQVEEEYTLDRIDLLAGLGPGEQEALRTCVTRRTWSRGTVVFREGDDGRELYIIARGSASVRIRLSGDNREKRLATFAAGTVFGELALLDAGPRSATVQADEDLVCYVLTEHAFAQLAKEHEAVAIKLLAGLGRELGRRLRRANQTIYQLEL
jgi:anti-anti-sigma regulatory factor